jgi:hypothetical protein
MMMLQSRIRDNELFDPNRKFTLDLPIGKMQAWQIGSIDSAIRDRLVVVTTLIEVIAPSGTHLPATAV